MRCNVRSLACVLLDQDRLNTAGLMDSMQSALDAYARTAGLAVFSGIECSGVGYVSASSLFGSPIQCGMFDSA